MFNKRLHAQQWVKQDLVICSQISILYFCYFSVLLLFVLNAKKKLKYSFLAFYLESKIMQLLFIILYLSYLRFPHSP